MYMGYNVEIHVNKGKLKKGKESKRAFRSREFGWIPHRLRDWFKMKRGRLKANGKQKTKTSHMPNTVANFVIG